MDRCWKYVAARSPLLPDGAFELQDESGRTVRVPVPSYQMPAVPKLSAGYFAQPQMDLVDLFIGSEGTLAIVVDATLRVIPMPRRSVALVMCESDQHAISVTAALRREATASWRGEGPLDVSAIEYIDARALAKTPDEAFVRAGVARPSATSAALLDADRNPKRRRRRSATPYGRPRRMWPWGRPILRGPWR